MPPTGRIPPCLAMPTIAAPMACSRMPKWMWRPPGSLTDCGVGAVEHGAVVAGEVGGARRRGRAGSRTWRRAPSGSPCGWRPTRRARRSGVRRPSPASPVPAQAACHSADAVDRSAERCRPRGVGRRRLARRRSARVGLDEFVGRPERLVGDAHHRLGAGDVVGLERVAVGLVVVGVVGRRVADVRAQDQQATGVRSSALAASSAASSASRSSAISPSSTTSQP